MGWPPYNLTPHSYSCWEGLPRGGSVKVKFQSLSREKTGRGGGLHGAGAGGVAPQARPRAPPPPGGGGQLGFYARAAITPSPTRAAPRLPTPPRIVPRAPLRRHGGRGADGLILRCWGRGGSRCKFRQVMIRTILRKLSYPRRSLRGGHLPVFSRRSALPPDPFPPAAPCSSPG